MSDPNSTSETTSSWASTIRMLGPGLLFAGAAIGVSHLVQSTRAGAGYGLGLIWLVLLIHILKYPFFEFGPRYASSTGETLLDGYKKMGKWTLVVMFIVSIGTMFTTQAAVTIVTASLAINIFGVFEDPFIWVIVLLGICAAIAALGSYSFLDSVIKVVIVVLAVSTVAAVILALSKEGNTNLSVAPVFPTDEVGLLFLVALMGWLPAPLDISVWHSVWAVEKQDATAEDFNMKSALFDFNVGYWGTVFLAICFLLLGAMVMFDSGETFSPKGGVFASQLISMYVVALGDWAKLFISIAAFTTMFSTTLTVFDGIPRVMAKLTNIIQENPKEGKEPKSYYWIWMAVLIVGTLSLLYFFSGSMVTMITIATVLSFLTAPFFAIINYKLITSEHTPEYARPGQGLRILSWIGIVFLIGFGLFYLSTFL